MNFIAARPEGGVCLFGAPFYSTTSFRPGARFGPKALRDASHGLETFSPLQEADLEDIAFMDKGDLELPFGDPKPALGMIEAAAGRILESGRTPFLLGGEHLVTLGALRAAYRLHRDLRVIHLDAHADLREAYLGQSLSHATVMRRALDIVGEEGLRQVGVRSCAREEYALACRLRVSDPQEIVAWAGESPCYLSCDLDILDPSVLTGTGTPEPGGLTFPELTGLLVPLLHALRIVALDVVELAPQLDPSGTSAVVAAKIVRESLLALGSARQAPA